MSLTEEQVKKIAKLSRIKLQDSEIEHFRTELSNIMDWIEELQEVNTDNVAEMASVANMNLPTREDAITEDNSSNDDVLKNAPNSEYGFFTVPKVVE